MKKSLLVLEENSLPGRNTEMSVSSVHAVNGNTIKSPFPDTVKLAMFGLGCFWGAERCFWQLKGVYSTAVGYSAGYTPNPNYEEVCSGLTGHNEVVLIVFEPSEISYEQLLMCFFESHDPTQYMRQGNDQGTQYRSGIYTYDEDQLITAKKMKSSYQQSLINAGLSEIQTEIVPVSEFYYAETYHQQYLHKNPNGYCGLGGTGVICG